jgi:hypothetical protein
MTKVWRCMLHGTGYCSVTRVSPCSWGTLQEIRPPKPPVECRVPANVLMDHVEKVEKEMT